MAIMQKLMEASWLRSLFFQQRVDARGAVVPKTWRTSFHQRVFEKGISVPWIFSLEQCHKFWEVPAGQEGVPNRPEDYASGPVAIMKYVLEYITPRIEPTDSVLEIGCNAGSKMNQLHLAGYTNLSGLELNPDCFKVLEAYFPELHANSTLYAGPAEEVLPQLETKKFACIYSVSSLQHIHPSQHSTFDHIARVCGAYLLTLELEWAGGQYFFPRNYRRVFETRGFAQVASTLITRKICPEPELNVYWGHVMRLFRRTAS